MASFVSSGVALIGSHSPAFSLLSPSPSVTKLSSPILSPPSVLSLRPLRPPPTSLPSPLRQGRPTPSLPPPPAAVARQGAKSRKHEETHDIKMAKSQEKPLPPPPPKRKASSPLKDARRSNRIAESKKSDQREL